MHEIAEFLSFSIRRKVMVDVLAAFVSYKIKTIFFQNLFLSSYLFKSSRNR